MQRSTEALQLALDVLPGLCTSTEPGVKEWAYAVMYIWLPNNFPPVLKRLCLEIFIWRLKKEVPDSWFSHTPVYWASTHTSTSATSRMMLHRSLLDEGDLFDRDQALVQSLLTLGFAGL